MKDALHKLRAPVLLALAGVYVAGLVYAVRLYAPCDDTYIYLVYVKNLYMGKGLSFNGMKVWGFTSVLWTGLLVGFGKVLPLELPRVADVASAVSGLFVMGMSYWAGRRMGLGRWPALGVPVLLAGTWDFAFYMGNGLETVFFAGMIVWSMGYVATEDPGRELVSKRLPAVLSLTILARPEGFLVAAVVVLYLGWRSRSVGGILRCGVWMVVWLLPVAVALKLYYGSWLPNTYYAKAGAGFSNADQGFGYLWNWVKAEWPVVVGLLWVVVMRRGVVGWVLLPFGALMAVWLLDVGVRGGDNMVGFRAILPIVPLMYLLIAAGFKRLAPRWLVAAVVAITISNVAVYRWGTVVGSSWGYPVEEQAANWTRYLTIRRDIGLHLKQTLGPNGLIALNAAGVIPYYAEMETIDMLGLNNEYIARHGDRDRSLAYGHQAGDGEYVLRRAPDVIMFGGAGSDKGVFLSDHQLLALDEFKRQYTLGLLPHSFRAYFKKP